MRENPCTNSISYEEALGDSGEGKFPFNRNRSLAEPGLKKNHHRGPLLSQAGPQNHGVCEYCGHHLQNHPGSHSWPVYAMPLSLTSAPLYLNWPLGIKK